jgi:type III secretion protein W
MSEPIQPISSVDIQKAQAAQSGAKAAMAQEAVEDSFTNFIDQFAVNTLQIIRQNGKTLEERLKTKVNKSDHTQEADSSDESLVEVEMTTEISDYYENKNPEVKGKTLQSLKEQISKFDTTEDVLQKILEAYPDPVNADAACEYLLLVLPDELKEKIFNARKTLNERFARKLRAGQNIFGQSLEFADQLGPPSQLRQLYSELTETTPEPLDLFEELLKKFTFEKMKDAISFWLNALGADLNSKGSSIQKGELKKLIDETRTLQAILGVYSFFASKQQELIVSLIRKKTEATAEMNFKNLAKLFVKILQDKYPSPDKILFLKHDLKIENLLHAQETILNIMCSAIKKVSPKLYRNQKHQEEVTTCFLMALEAIDNVLDEYE